jgi:HrpA-like RNA helicase
MAPRFGRYSAGAAAAARAAAGRRAPGSVLHSFPGVPSRGAPPGASPAAGGAAPPGIAPRPARVDKLPAHMIGTQLQRKLESDRVVFVQGYTGSGKSSQIPQILLDGPKPWFQGGDGKVLCTQPRRLAVAAVSRRVAQERRCKLGEEVGYSIGQQSLRSTRTRLLFSTAGIALEMLRAVGPEALLEFAVIVVDEIHERSEQSDLLLTCLREYMLHDRRLRSLRLVLMSATFDRVRYTQYFQDLGEGGKAMHTLPIPKSVGKMLGQHLHTVKLKYLQDALEVLESDVAREEDTSTEVSGASGGGQRRDGADTELVSGPLTAAERQMAWDFDADLEEPTVSPMLHRLVSRLLYRVHGPGAVAAAAHSGDDAAAAAAELDSSFSTALVFLPTYRTLEEQHQLLTQLGCFRIAVLHSSVDIEESLRSIGAASEDDKDGSGTVPMNEDGEVDEAAAAELRKPKVILATNVAESSLTIPGVSLVIDLCRRLQVSWDREKGVSKAETRWASISQCNQRYGRTGRCNSGTVYRLIPQKLWNDGVLPLWEPSELTLSDLAESSLLLATAAHRTMRAVDRIMSLCIDKPDPRTVTDAMQRLIGWGLLKAKDRKATTFGAVIGQLPVSLQAGRLAVIGSCAGLMQPASVLAAILSTTPEPILKSLGAREEHEESLSRFSGRVVASADRCGSLLAQLAAYEWWDAAWVDRQRLRKLDVTLADAPACSNCACTLSSADLLFIREQAGAAGDGRSPADIVESGVCLDCHAQQQGGEAAPTAPLSESSEERWCRRENLSLVALRAVKQTAEVVRAVLTKADVRQALWDPRNRHCSAALWPARPVERAVDCRLPSVMDPVGDGEIVRQLQQLVETVVTPPRRSAVSRLTTD